MISAGHSSVNSSYDEVMLLGYESEPQQSNPLAAATGTSHRANITQPASILHATKPIKKVCKKVYKKVKDARKKKCKNQLKDLLTKTKTHCY